MLRSLNMLKERQRSVSGGSVQGIHTSTSSPMLVSRNKYFLKIYNDLNMILETEVSESPRSESKTVD